MTTSHKEDEQADAVDLGRTRRRFLLAREQAAQASADHYRAVRQMRGWPNQNGGRRLSGTRRPERASAATSRPPAATSRTVGEPQCGDAHGVDMTENRSATHMSTANNIERGSCR
jgi:hypothetical protein